MLKNVAKLEQTIEGKTGYFFCDNDTPIPVAKEMLFQFLKFLGQIEDNVKAQMAAAQKEQEQSLPTADHSVNTEPKPAE